MKLSTKTKKFFQTVAISSIVALVFVAVEGDDALDLCGDFLEFAFDVIFGIVFDVFVIARWLNIYAGLNGTPFFRHANGPRKAIGKHLRACVAVVLAMK